MKKLPPKLSVGEETLWLHIRAARLPAPDRQFRYHPNRNYSFDFCWQDLSLAVEVDGGNRLAHVDKSGRAFAVGRHTQDGDYRKLNEAAVLGYIVLRFTPKMVVSGEAINVIEHFFKKQSEQPK